MIDINPTRWRLTGAQNAHFGRSAAVMDPSRGGIQGPELA